MATTGVHSQPSSPHRSSRSFGGFVRQTLKLTRTEFVLFYRYRVALFAAVIPGVFVLPAFLGDEGEILPGVGGIAYTLAGMFALAGMTVGIIHLANVYTARREQMVLKRFRLGGTPPRTLFAASTLSVLGIAVLQAIAIILVIGLRLDTWPQDPVMLAFSIVLVTVAMSLFGIAITPMARDAENAQMMSMGPFIPSPRQVGSSSRCRSCPSGCRTSLPTVRWCRPSIWRAAPTSAMTSSQAVTRVPRSRPFLSCG